MKIKIHLITAIAGASLVLTACSGGSDAAAVSEQVTPLSSPSVGQSDVVSPSASESTPDQTSSLPSSAAESAEMSETGSTAAALPPDITGAAANVSTAGSTSPSPAAETVCGTTEFVEDAYHFATSGHDFVQICSPAGADGGVILSYVYEDIEADTVAINFQYGQDYRLNCGFAAQIPICLVQAADSSGKSFQGSLYRLTNEGTLEPMTADAQSSSVEMTLVPLPASDSSQAESLMLIQGWIFNDLGTSATDAPVGYQTSKIDPDAVTISGCTGAYTGGYPELPTQPNTGPCDASAELINN